MAGSAEFVRLVDLAETVGARREPTKAIAFSPQAPIFFFFFNIIGFLVIFRSLYEILEHLWRNFGKIYRPFLEIFVAKPTPMCFSRSFSHFLLSPMQMCGYSEIDAYEH